MKKKVLIYASQITAIKRFVEVFDRQLVDVIAALSARQVIEVTAVRTPEIILVVLTDDLVGQHTDLLLRLPQLAEEYIIFNLSSIRSNDLRAICEHKQTHCYSSSDLKLLLEYVALKMKLWSGKVQAPRLYKRALLVDGHLITQNSLNALLLSHQFQVECARSFEDAEDQLLENKYDLVVTNSYRNERAGDNLITIGRMGCNKNTAFFFLTLRSTSTVANKIGNFDPQRIFVSPFDLGAIDERIRLIH